MLYKEFLLVMDEGLAEKSFVQEHKLVYWNLVLYCKILKLPLFILDYDTTPQHLKV